MGLLVQRLSKFFGIQANLNRRRLEDGKLFDIFASFPVCTIDRVVEGDFNPILFSVLRSLQCGYGVWGVRAASHSEPRIFC